MKQITAKIEMAPFAKPRARVTKRSTYYAGKYTERLDKLKALYLAAGGVFDIPGPVTLDLLFLFKMPKSWSVKKSVDMLNMPCLKRPDADNLAGAVMDAIFGSDSNIYRLSAQKYWQTEDAIHIRIMYDEEGTRAIIDLEDPWSLLQNK